MKRRILNVLIGLLTLFIVFGCGGGGGSSSGSSEPVSSSGDVFEFSADSLSFSYSIGEPAPESQILTVWFGGASRVDAGFPPGVSEPLWLNFAKVDPYDNSSPVAIRFSLDTASVTAGNHSTIVRFVAYNFNGDFIGHRDLPINCVIYNQLGVDSPELSFSHIDGSPTAPAAQSLSIYGVDLSWTASVDQSWVRVSESSGTAPTTLEVDVDPTGLSTGNHSATLTLTDTISGHIQDVTVNLVVEPQMLLVEDNGVAFTSFPTAPSALSYSVLVYEEAGSPANWTADTAASWLSVTPNGVTGDSLVLSADPYGLAEDTIHYATVTVSSGDPSISNTETISVGFYVSSTDPAVSELPYRGKAIAADPIRPYVYVADDTVWYGDDEAVIDIINIYTGATEGTIIAGRDITAMVASSDGKMLYLADGHDSSIVPVLLDTQTAGSKWTGSALNIYGRLEYARFNGKGFIITSGRQIFDATDGSLDATIGYPMFYYIVMAASQRNSSFYATETGLSGYSFDLSRYTCRYSFINNSLNIERTHIASYPSMAARDIAVNKDGSKIYMAAGPLHVFLFDGEHLTESTTLSGRTLDVGLDERLLAGVDVFYTNNVDPDLVTYGPDDTPGPDYTLIGEITGPHCLSGDGLQMIFLTESYSSSYLTVTSISP